MAGSGFGAPRQMENLGRGLIGLKQADGRVFLSWRWLGTESDAARFNVYRTVGEAAPVKLNATPMTNVTWFVDQPTAANVSISYVVRAILNGKETEPSAPFRLASGTPARDYLSVPLQLPAGYSANDGSVGDLDGDGEYEIVLKSEQRPRDTASTGLTGETILQGYKLDGKLLWTINLGKNIREGAHS
jgi:rhamnogalacturonan endolyase